MFWISLRDLLGIFLGIFAIWNILVQFWNFFETPILYFVIFWVFFLVFLWEIFGIRRGFSKISLRQKIPSSHKFTSNEFLENKRRNLPGIFSWKGIRLKKVKVKIKLNVSAYYDEIWPSEATLNEFLVIIRFQTRFKKTECELENEKWQWRPKPVYFETIFDNRSQILFF